MYEPIRQMLNNYKCHSQQDYVNALKEIVQQIALLGLWRAKFFENAAFYGGSALRILYGLDRFSEDLDFSLLKPNKNFVLNPYNKSIEQELSAFGFMVAVQNKVKSFQSNIESAFIKAGTKQQLITITAPSKIINTIHHMHTIKIKMEVDINPPELFSTETKYILQPIPFSIKSFIEPDLFAGKVHALLCRPWQSRVKGRDWYDFVWYVARKTPINLVHLRERLIQSKAWQQQVNFDKHALIELLTQKIMHTDFANAKKDVIPFVKDTASVSVWSQDFFLTILQRLQVINSDAM